MKEELRKELLNDLIEFENGNKTLLMTFNKLFESACNQLDKLEAKDKECAAKIAAGERLRVEDAMSAINEANGLREKIKDQELIIYGIEEGAEQWKSLCADKDRGINELREYKRLNTIGLSGYTPEELHDQIADLKAKLEAADNRERFEMPCDKTIIDFAILFNDGRLDPEQLSNMVGMCQMILDRLHEHGNVRQKSKQEIIDEQES